MPLSSAAHSDYIVVYDRFQVGSARFGALKVPVRVITLSHPTNSGILIIDFDKALAINFNYIHYQYS